MNEADRSPRPLRIGVLLTLDRDAGELFADARALEAAGADSLWVEGDGAEPYVLLAACAAVTWRVGLVASGGTDAAAMATCDRLSRGRLRDAEALARAGEHWIRESLPADRAAWRKARDAAVASGATGLVVPNDARLMDLLRNPDQEDDRADLNIAVG